ATAVASLASMSFGPDIEPEQSIMITWAAVGAGPRALSEITEIAASMTRPPAGRYSFWSTWTSNVIGWFIGGVLPGGRLEPEGRLQQGCRADLVGPVHQSGSDVGIVSDLGQVPVCLLQIEPQVAFVEIVIGLLAGAGRMVERPVQLGGENLHRKPGLP